MSVCRPYITGQTIPRKEAFGSLRGSRKAVYPLKHEHYEVTDRHVDAIIMSNYLNNLRIPFPDILPVILRPRRLCAFPFAIALISFEIRRPLYSLLLMLNFFRLAIISHPFYNYSLNVARLSAISSSRIPIYLFVVCWLS